MSAMEWVPVFLVVMYVLAGRRLALAWTRLWKDNKRWKDKPE